MSMFPVYYEVVEGGEIRHRCLYSDLFVLSRNLYPENFIFLGLKLFDILKKVSSTSIMKWSKEARYDIGAYIPICLSYQETYTLKISFS